MTTALKMSLEKVLQAYTIGDQKFTLAPIQKPPVGIGSYLPEEDRCLLRSSAELIEQGLAAARRGDLIASQQFFDSSQAMLSGIPLSEEGLLIFKVAYNTAASYLDYRRNDFFTALARIDEALVIDEQLEQKRKEYASLHLHRIQLLLNSVQVNARRNHVQEALIMCFHILDYLERKTKSIPAPSSWDSASLTQLSQKIIADLFIGAMYKIASMVAGRNTLMIEGQPIEVRDLFAGARMHIQMDSAEDCYLSPLAHGWLRAKQALLDDDYEGFLTQTADLLAEGRGDAPVLWYATLVDLFAFCQQLGLPEAANIKDRIEQAPEQVWKHLPCVWKQ